MVRLMMVLLFAYFLAACDAPADDIYLAQANAQATQQAASARLKATEAARGNAVLQVTLQAAQTAGAAEAEIRALEMRMTATQAALDVGYAQAEATRQAGAANTLATQQAGQRETELRMTATAQAAIMNQVAREDQERAMRARWQEIIIPIQAMFPTLFGFAILILLALAGVFAYRRFMPVLETRGRTYPRGPHDAPIYFYQDPEDRVIILDPDRSFGPALIAGPGGVETAGAAHPALQAGVTARDQYKETVRVLPPGVQVPAPDESPQSAPLIEIVDQSNELNRWASEVERKLLTGGGE